MPCARLMRLLEQYRVSYEVVRHPAAFTAQEVAAATHIPGKQLAKAVVVKLDGKLAMAVVPATRRVDLQRLSEFTGRTAKLAEEWEFREAFPGCEVGAMPPFGRLWEVELFAARCLADDRTIAFPAGMHDEVVIMDTGDYEALAEPKFYDFATAR